MGYCSSSKLYLSVNRFNDDVIMMSLIFLHISLLISNYGNKLPKLSSSKVKFETQLCFVPSNWYRDTIDLRPRFNAQTVTQAKAILNVGLYQ